MKFRYTIKQRNDRGIWVTLVSSDDIAAITAAKLSLHRKDVWSAIDNETGKLLVWDTQEEKFIPNAKQDVPRFYLSQRINEQWQVTVMSDDVHRINTDAVKLAENNHVFKVYDNNAGEYLQWDNSNDCVILDDEPLPAPKQTDHAPKMTTFSHAAMDSMRSVSFRVPHNSPVHDETVGQIINSLLKCGMDVDLKWVDDPENDVCETRIEGHP